MVVTGDQLHDRNKQKKMNLCVWVLSGDAVMDLPGICGLAPWVWVPQRRRRSPTRFHSVGVCHNDLYVLSAQIQLL